MLLFILCLQKNVKRDKIKEKITKGGVTLIKTDIILNIGYNEKDIKTAISAALPISDGEIGEVTLLKRSLNLSDTAKPHYRATVAFSLDPERERGLLKYRKRVFEYSPPPISFVRSSLDFRPVVVGAGPAGLFAALVLAESGARPIILERGLPAEERTQRINLFNTLGILDTECNVQFGEGGAGTYSDGKLKVGSMDKYKMKVLSEFISAGADESIAYSTDAHLGTDKLPSIVKSIREKIISLGGEFIFSARMSALKIKDSSLIGLKYVKGGKEVTLDTRAAILSIGHSARDTISMLFSSGIKMTPKGFGIGVRIEHPREYINKIIYKEANGLISDTASYHLVTHLPCGRSVYSFCMCPGGTVVAATSLEGGVVTNGMSEYKRMADNSNAALLVSVTRDDFESESPLAGFALQEKIERAAFNLSASYRAPSQSLSSLLSGTPKMSALTPSYPQGTVCCSINEYMPSFISESLVPAISDFDAWLPGYMYGDALLTGPETRTTSPVRMERSENGEAEGFFGIYPAGEGAGYSGGIVSSATDGIRAAEKLLFNNKNNK